MSENTANQNNNTNDNADKVTVEVTAKKREFSLRKALMWGGAGVVAVGAVGAGVFAVIRGRNPGGVIDSAARVVGAAASFATKR